MFCVMIHMQNSGFGVQLCTSVTNKSSHFHSRIYADFVEAWAVTCTDSKTKVCWQQVCVLFIDAWSRSFVEYLLSCKVVWVCQK